MFKLNLFKKAVLVVMIAALGFAVLPVSAAYAQGTTEGERPQLTDERLAELWAKGVEMYNRQGEFLDKADELIARTEQVIARLNEKGIDTTAVQAALDAFEDAVRAAQPVHAQGNGIVNSHQGFDGNGQVTDRARAIESLQALRANLKEFRATMGGTGQALRDALKALRDTYGGQRPNRPAGEAPTP